MTSGRQNFVESWMRESPEGMPATNLIDILAYNIRELLFLRPTIDLGNNLKKIELDQFIYYWYEIADEIVLAIELEKHPQCVEVRQIGKLHKGQPPFASDLYAAILSDLHTAIRSDSKLSDEGLKIWKQLLDAGFTVSVYNIRIPGQTRKTFSNPEELDAYFKHDDKEYRRYQYVVTEAQHHAEVLGAFNGRRLREMANITNDDDYFPTNSSLVEAYDPVLEAKFFEDLKKAK
jgi:hypothetical protein